MKDRIFAAVFTGLIYLAMALIVIGNLCKIKRS